MPRTWKAALAPFLAGIPERIGLVGELRFGLLNDLRCGERKRAAHDRPVRRAGAAARARRCRRTGRCPSSRCRRPKIAAWRERRGLADGPAVVAFAPGAVGPCKALAGRSIIAELARRSPSAGIAVWILGGPARSRSPCRSCAPAGPLARDLTGNDLRNAILALAAADVAVSNDSGLMHVAAALGTPTVGIFGPTSPWHWAPLNPIAATVQT